MEVTGGSEVGSDLSWKAYSVHYLNYLGRYLCKQSVASRSSLSTCQGLPILPHSIHSILIGLGCDTSGGLFRFPNIIQLDD